MYLDSYIYCNKQFISVGVLLRKKISFIKFRVLLKESACYSAGFNVGNTVYEFSKRAINHYENGKQTDLLGYVVGYKKGNKLIATELVFPNQSCIKPRLSNSTRNDRGNI